MKKISISLIVALLIGGMLLNGCSNGTAQINSVEANSAESTKQETLKSNKLDSKLIELYQSTKEKQKENDERNIFGIDEAKFDKDGKLWVKCVEAGDIYRKDQIMIENHVFTIYDSIDKHIQYWKEVGIKMNTEQVVSNNCFKDVVGKPEESTLQEFQTIENEFENMKDYYDEINTSNVAIDEKASDLNSNYLKINHNINWTKNNEIIINLLNKYEYTDNYISLKNESDNVNLTDNINSIQDDKLSREDKFARYKKLNNIFSKICFENQNGAWTYLELTNDFKQKFNETEGLLNPVKKYIAKFLKDFWVINNNIVSFVCEGNEHIAEYIDDNNANSLSFYGLIIYDKNGNIDDIRIIERMPVNSGDSIVFAIDGYSEAGLYTLAIGSAAEDPPYYTEVATTDRFWNSYKPERGILDVDAETLKYPNYIEVENYDANTKKANINIYTSDKVVASYLIKWKTNDYDLLDEIEVIKLNAISEYKNNKLYVNGTEQNNKWVYYNGYWYYCDSNGNPVTNKWVDGRYLDENGRKMISNKTPDGKYVDDMGYVIENLSYDLASSARMKDILLDTWYKTRSGLWYYFENNRTTTKRGWFTDSRDNQTYYLEPDTGIMQVGYVDIDGETYYFNESTDNEPNWYEVGNGIYESYGKKVKAYGSMFRDEETPDGKRVDADGKLIK